MNHCMRNMQQIHRKWKYKQMLNHEEQLHDWKKVEVKKYQSLQEGNKTGTFQVDVGNISVYGYQRNSARTYLYYIACVLSAGFIWLLGYWYPWKRVRITHNLCALNQADIVIVTSSDGQKDVCKVVEVRINCHKSIINNDLVKFEQSILEHGSFRYFEYVFLKYLILKSQVIELSGLDRVLTSQDIQNYKTNGLSNETRQVRHLIHGENHINVPVQSFFIYILREAASPFYLFQVFSFIIWLIQNYFYYPIVIFVITIASILTTAYQTQKQMKDLQDMVGHPYHVNCLEGKKVIKKSSRDLVPGDILMISEDGLSMPCDVILLDSACVVNESSLTGESFPVSKKAFDGKTISVYDIKNEKLHTIQYGTEVLQAQCRENQQYVPSLVIRTGFCTLKGRLIREIVYPKSISFVFYKDAFKFIAVLAVLGILGSIYTVLTISWLGNPMKEIILRSIGVITIIIPPALPACLSVGIVVALKKLKKKQIYCIDSQRINMCGGLDLFVFDKTGTITEDHLDVKGAYEYRQGCFVKITPEDFEKNTNSLIMKGTACCHNLHLLNGEVSGNPVDTGMFKFSKWSLDIQKDLTFVAPPTKNGNCITILKDFHFESALQLMSVITKESGCNFVTVYMKGSPEKVFLSCIKESIPDNAQAFLEAKTMLGHRVLAIASKNIEEVVNAQTLPRSSVESNLNFIGFICFENTIKTVSTATICTLKNGGIRNIMATGDHLNTAVSVAREVGIISKGQKVYELKVDDKKVFSVEIPYVSSKHKIFAQNDSLSCSDERERLVILSKTLHINYSIVLTGAIYRLIKKEFPDLLPKVLMSATVYGRMLPLDKTFLVEDLKGIGYEVGMCGDGANDCGALRAANAGIALSQMEASVASPFTSKVYDISCVPTLIREGRAALVTSFSVFKYMAIYSFIQFIGVLIMFSKNIVYGDWQYFYADLILVFALAVVMSRNDTSASLAKQKPPVRLSDLATISFVLLHLSIVLLFQFIPFFVVEHMSWYQPPKALKTSGNIFNLPSYENYAVVCVAFYQYIWVALVCFSGEPYCKPLYKNGWFVFVFIFDIVLTTVVIFSPYKFMKDIFEFPKFIPTPLCISIVAYSVVNMLVFLFANRIFQSVGCRKKMDKLGKNSLTHAHDILLHELAVDTTWPPALKLKE